MASKIKIKFKDKRNDVILVQDRISNSSKYSLRPGLRSRRITPYSRDIQPIPEGACIINFGGSVLPDPIQRIAAKLRILNPPDKVALSANKLRTFELLKAANVASVRWTTSSDEVRKWLGKGYKALARLSLASSGGRGIRVLGPDVAEQLPEAPLFTRYFPKTHEFRVHVVGEEAVDLTEKKLRDNLRDERGERSVIRNHDNGWVHAHDNLAVTAAHDIEALRNLGVNAIRAVGLDFGAADILACLDDSTPRRLSKAVVCEVNAAPGIENTATRQAYVRGLNKLIAERK